MIGLNIMKKNLMIIFLSLHSNIGKLYMIQENSETIMYSKCENIRFGMIWAVICTLTYGPDDNCRGHELIYLRRHL